MKVHKILLVGIFLLTLTCIEKKNQNYPSEQLPGIEKINNVYRIIRYSNVLIKINGKIIKIPIYGGTYGDVEYEKLELKQYTNDVYTFQHYIPVNKGHVNETFQNILNFYKQNLLKNVNVYNPIEIISDEHSESLYLIRYQFENEGIPSDMEIAFQLDYEGTDEKIKKMGKEDVKDYTVDMYYLKEDQQSILVSISVGVPADLWLEKKE